MCHLADPIYHCEDGRVTLGGGKTGNYVQGNLGLNPSMVEEEQVNGAKGQGEDNEGSCSGCKLDMH